MGSEVDSILTFFKMNGPDRSPTGPDQFEFKPVRELVRTAEDRYGPVSISSVWSFEGWGFRQTGPGPGLRVLRPKTGPDRTFKHFFDAEDRLS